MKKVRQKKSIEDLKSFACNHGGKCLSQTYIRLKDHFEWECNKGHRWSANGANVLNGSWCPTCSLRKPITIEDLHNKATAKGGQFLSQIYMGGQIKHEWKCKAGHLFQMRPHAVQQGQWCPECGWGGKPNIAQAKELAQFRGGKCLSTEYKNAKTRLNWKCAFNHEWPAVFNNVKNGAWCPKCAKIAQGNRQRGTLKEMQDIAKERGGKCLATEYIDSFTKLPFQCQHGHDFLLKPNRLKQGGWCKHCNTFIGESICRYYLEQIFGVAFPKSNPSWLFLNRGSYELDGYSEQLGLAFEHHGTYHYVIDRQRSKTVFDLTKRQENDKKKAALCLQNNIKLIIIPALFNITKLKDLGKIVLEQCKAQGIHIPYYQPSKGMNFNSAYIFPYNNSMLEKLHKQATEKKGRCLATTWLGSETKLPFECEKNHLFSARPFDILKGHWCLKCSGRYPVGLEGVKELIKSYGAECLSETYKSVYAPLLFKCKNGFVFEDSYANLKTRKIFCRCLKCSSETPIPIGFHNRKALGIKGMNHLAESYQGHCLSETYINGASYLVWQCQYGFNFKATYNQIIARKWFCPCCNHKKIKNKKDI